VYISRRLRGLLMGATGCLLVIIYVPLILVVLYAFNPSRSQKWPIQGFTLQWVSAALTNPGARDAVVLSVEVGLVATGIALVLGSLLAAAVHRYRFFGRTTVSFLVILPIALPGIVTGIALNASFRTLFGGLSLFTLIIGHATFCVVTVYNNVIARLRRTSGSLVEASADLGADPWQTFRHVTFPAIRSALLAGGLLAFALSFDEIVVTTFTAGSRETLPIWIFANLSRPNQLPIVNAVAFGVIILSAIPVYFAQRLAGDAVSIGEAARA
jgi:putative spermidine/putrescine transport system permease protein